MDTDLYDFMLEADRDFTGVNGAGIDHRIYDEAMKQSVVAFNNKNGTEHDPRESLHDYLDAQMAIHL